VNTKAWKRKIVKQAKEQGWRVREGSKHTLLYPLDGGRPCALPKGSNGNGYGNQRENSEKNLRKRGLRI
jgi:hypothetical protein